MFCGGCRYKPKRRGTDVSIHRQNRKEGIMFKNKLKRLCAVALAGMMVVSVSACSTSKSAEKNSVSKAEQATEATTEAAKNDTTADYVASGVELPDNFENMIYPIEALMLQNYSKGYPYYANGASEEKSDSFWFSMAALTSLMENESAYGDGIEMDSYYYLKENTSNMYASALYNAYGMGNMEFPEIPDGDKYATYDDGKQMYGFLKGDVSSLAPYITKCVKDGSDYIITSQLRDKDTDEVKGTYEVTITASSFDGDDNCFAYSATAIRKIEETDSENQNTSSESEETSTQSTENEESTDADSNTVSTSENGESTDATDSTSSTESAEGISQDDALSQAKDYYGEDAEYSYKKKVTVGDKEYYDFSVSGDDISSTDVLVSVDGQDVIGGTQNDDGSWSFDQ